MNDTALSIEKVVNIFGYDECSQCGADLEGRYIISEDFGAFCSKSCRTAYLDDAISRGAL